MLSDMKSKTSCLSEIGMDAIWIFPADKSGIFYLSDKTATRSKKKNCQNDEKGNPTVKIRTHRKSRHP
jgi:hypothetical protein